MSHSPFSPLHCSAGSLLESLRVLPSTGYKTKFDSDQGTRQLVEDAKKEVARVNDVFVRNTIKARQLLRALLDNAVDDNGQRYTACVILATQGDTQLLQDVALAWLENLLYPIKAAAKQPNIDPSGAQSKIINETPGPTVSEMAARGQSSLLTLLRRRENNRCPITGFARLGSSSKPSDFYASHILRLTWTDHGDKHSLKSYQASVTEDMINNWCSLDMLGMDSDSPCNTIFLHRDAHLLLQNFVCWFESTEVEDEYIIRSTCAVALGGKKVTFSDHSRSNIPLPSPRYLAMHAAFAKALHQSGAGQYFDSSLSDNMHEASGLSSDGTSDIGFLLSSLVLGG